MIIDCMKMCNFGVYKGSHSIDFTPISGEQKITLIGGLNGTGKTSLLDALQIGMFGVNVVENRDEVSYHKLLKQKISNGQKKACIEIAFRHVANGEETSYCVQREFTLNTKNEIEEEVCIFEGKKKNDFLSSNWDVQSNIYFPARLKNLFVFDGEKILLYSSKESLRRLTENSLKILFGLDNIEQLEKDLEYYSTQKQKLNTSKDVVIEVEKLEHRIEKVKGQITRLRQEKANIQSSKIDKNHMLLREAEIRYKEAGGTFFDRKEEISRQVDREVEKTEAKEKQLINAAGTELPLVLISELIQRTYDQVANEEQMKYKASKEKITKQRDIQLLKMLSELDVPPSTIESIKERLELEYHTFNTEDTTKKVTVDVQTQNFLENLLNEQLKKSESDARRMIEEMQIQRSKLKFAIEERDSIPEKGTVGQLDREIKTLKRRIEVNIGDYQACQIKIRDLSSLRDALQLERNELLKEQTENNHKNQDVERSLLHVNKAKATLELLRRNLTVESVKEVMDELISCLKIVCHDTLPIEKVQIDQDSFELSVYSLDGKWIDVEQLSAGQRQLVCLAVLLAYKNLSGWMLPIIIDTPLSRLDSAHRENLLYNYLPNVSHQVVILSTDKEIDRNIRENLNDWLARAYTLEFDKVTQSTSIVPGYFGCEE